MLDVYLKPFELCYFEVQEAFTGLRDENVWRRPGGGLLSIGELAGHMAYWEVARFGGDSADGSSARDLSNCKVQSPLLDPRFGYYTSTIENAPLEKHLRMSGTRVLEELLCIHQAAMDHLKELNPELDSPAPYWAPHSNYRELLTYMAFHVAYHTGQMYSVRHLLGETTPDN